MNGLSRKIILAGFVLSSAAFIAPTFNGSALAESPVRQIEPSAVRYAYTPLVLKNESYVSVVTPANQQKVNKRLSILLAKIHEQLSDLSGQPLKITVGVKLLPQKTFFEETKAPLWTNAMFYKDEILVPVKDFKKIDWKSLSKTIRHEYTHAVTHALSNGACPAWIDEGLAQLVERSGNKILDKSLGVWLAKHKPISLSSLSHGFTKLDLKAVGPAYAQSKVAVAKLLERPEGLSELFKLIRLTRILSLEQAFKLVYAQDFSDFEKELGRNLIDLDSRQALLRSRNDSLTF